MITIFSLLLYKNQIIVKKKLRNVNFRYGVCCSKSSKASNHCTANPASKVIIEADKVKKFAGKQRHIESFYFVVCI